jgi:hypothetical protein
MIDYGIITICFPDGPLTDDQRLSIVNMSVENQLVTSDRSHYVDILHDCKEFSKFAPIKITWVLLTYKYTMNVLKQETCGKHNEFSPGLGACCIFKETSPTDEGSVRNTEGSQGSGCIQTQRDSKDVSGQD